MKSNQLNQVRVDPCMYLNVDCMKHIFGYIGGKSITFIRTKVSSNRRNKNTKERNPLPGPGPYWSVREAARFCLTLASVSSKWKKLVDQSVSSIISVQLDVDLNLPSSEEALKTWLSWLCLHKPSIGRLRCRRHCENLANEITCLVRNCNTSSLRHVELAMAPSALAMSELQNLQLAIGQQCPNLETVSIYVAANEETARPGFLEPLLFSRVTGKFEIWLIAARDHVTDQDGRALNALVRDLPGVLPMEQSVIERLSWQHPNELRYEPIQSNYCLGIATQISYSSPSFGTPIQLHPPRRPFALP